MANYVSGYNPDVLSCLANLSNDEVFTPPEIANAMLDMLPQELFADPRTKFLDPACKSGVFLREIAKRLLEAQLPHYKAKINSIDGKKSLGEPLNEDDKAFQALLQEKIDHIFHEQLYGIAITELTSLLSRRSIYCSKYPNSKYSVTSFDDTSGNIRYRNTKHYWKKGKCTFCGASENEYKREDILESHAYEFIHTISPKDLLKMKFDVIISNPPYQLSTASESAQAKPIYQLFVEQAIKLKPSYIIMIIPARWYAGGWGLDAFRDKMLTQCNLEVIHDFPNTSECFPGINIRGGVCYFLWNRNKSTKECTIVNHFNNNTDTFIRPLLEEGEETFIRYNKAIGIFRKVMQKNERPFIDLVSSQKPFGLATNYIGSENKDRTHPIKVYTSKGRISFASIESISKGQEMIGKYKLLMSKASPGADEYPHAVLSKPIISEPNSACTESYITIGPFDSEEECNNVSSYIQTRFFRFLVMLKKPSMDTLRKVYKLVPMQDFSKKWSDEELFAKYNISEDEVAFINALIKPIE